MNLKPRTWASVALSVGVACAATPAIAQDRTLVARQSEKAVQRTPELPFGPAIKVVPDRQQPQRVEAPPSAPAVGQQAAPLAVTKPAALGAGASPATAQQVWTLEPGMPLHVQLRNWADKAGWQLEWKVPRSWLVPARTEFIGRFDEALEKVVVSLTNEGKPLQLNIWEGNHVAEVLEVTPR